MIALVPARAGSKRLPNKNLLELGGLPLICWTLRAAFNSEVFSEVYVSTESAEIAEVAVSYTGCEHIHRPPWMAEDESSDIDWVKHALGTVAYRNHKGSHEDTCSIMSGQTTACTCGEMDPEFAILRPTSPFRDEATIQRAKLQWDDIKGPGFIKTCGCSTDNGLEFRPTNQGFQCTACEGLTKAPKGYDSMRAVRKSSEHPMKQWQYDPESHELYSWMKAAHHQHLHSRPTQTLADSWIQTAGLEMGWCRVPVETGTIAGERVAGFVLEGPESWDINTQEDFDRCVLHIHGLKLRSETAAGAIPTPRPGLAGHPVGATRQPSEDVS